MIQDLLSFFSETGFGAVTWQMLVMWVVVGVLFYLAIAKGFEPLLLVPIAFGALLANLPTRGLLTITEDAHGDAQYAVINVESEIHHQEILDHGVIEQKSQINRVEGGLFDFISQGIKLELVVQF